MNNVIQMKQANAKPGKKKKTFKENFLKQIRISLWKKKTFVGTYWNNRNDLIKFLSDNNIILIHLDHGKERLSKFDFRLENTQAQKKDRKLVLYYVEDNVFMRWLGFKNNMIERSKLGV